MKDRFGQILYVGKAKNLKKRVSTYFHPARRKAIAQPKIRNMVSLIHDLDVIEVRSETEAILLEGKLIKQYKPRYNTDFTDDKRFLLVRVDVQSSMPNFRLVRHRREDGARYYGPYAHSGFLRQTLVNMRKKFGILLGDTRPRRLPDGSYRLYDDIRQEIYGHPNRMTCAEYRERVEQACQFLEGKTRDWVDSLYREMQAAAERQDFERAANLRDAYHALTNTLSKTRKFTRNLPEQKVDIETSLDDLRDILNLPERPASIECFDISHISGTYCVASMVHFTNGQPDRKQYRRYKIRSFSGNDDYRAMEEVIGRRYRRLDDEGKPLPDIVLIDGGKGQVHAAIKAFLVQDIPPPPLIGLAKKFETLIFPNDRDPVKLEERSPALKLLQRIRDEAHRFANSFNADLRSKKIRESILDEVPGLGAAKKRSLISHFKTVAGIKKATPEALREVNGIGPKLANEIHQYLKTPDNKR